MVAAQLALFPDDAPASESPTPLLAPVRVERGDLWALGNHRLLCGDATCAEDVARLMGGVKVDVLLTDPPYGMRLDTDFTSMKGGRDFRRKKSTRGGSRYAPVSGDNANFNASHVLRHLGAIPEQFWFGADYYAATLGDTMHAGAWLVWDKRCSEQFDRMFGSSFEMIWSRKRHKRDVLRHRWAGIFGTEREPIKRRLHPTQKPLPLIEDIFTRYSKPHMRVVDPYLGSGTTLIACERTRRTCYGMEIEPHYCDIILRRWEQATGQTAILLERAS